MFQLTTKNRNYLCSLCFHCEHISKKIQACISLSFLPSGGGGGKSKGLVMGKEIKGGKKEKKENLGKIKLFTVLNHKN